MMPTATGITTLTGKEKDIFIDNAVGVSSISSNIISLKTNHDLITGEQFVLLQIMVFYLMD